MLRLSQNPPMLTQGAQSVAQLPGPWWVAHTKARFEKAFAWDLGRRNIGYFLPLIERLRISGGKKRRVLLPLFSSYVFFSGGPKERSAAMSTNRLCQTIEVVDQDRLCDELVAIEKTLANKAQVDPYPFAAIGRRCRITAGPLRDVEGVVIRRGKSTRIVLQVSALGQGVSMEIDADLLEPVE